jgi:hypothetical protein
MPGINLFDTVTQNYGRLDELVAVANDNSFSINDEVSETLILNPYEGDVKKKDAIALQSLTFNNDYAAIESEAVTELLDFDGIDDYVELDSIPDITGNKTVSFKLFLPLAIPSTTKGIIDLWAGGTAGDHLMVYAAGGGTPRLFFQVSNISSNNFTIDYASISNQELDIVMVKTAGVVSSVTINGVPQVTSSVGSTTGQGITATIGRVISFGNLYYDGLIWDLDINSEHQYVGYPAGNLDPAWADTIGSINGTVYGSPGVIDLP